MSDWELLQTYAKNRSDAAFAELVRRHLNWVHSAALRQTRDPHLAEDVTQAVFVLLARKAVNLRPGTILSGWLFRTTRFVASRALRTEYRRKAREQTAVAMSPTTTSSDENENLWSQLTPHLDQAVAALSETDRAAILLRFYEKKPLHEVGQQLGLSDDAAKKRVTRAIEKMRSFLTRRGVVLGGAGLIAILAEQTVHAAPANLALGVVKAATTSLSASAILPQLARETLHAWRLAKLKLIAGIAAISVTGIVLAINLAPHREPNLTREPLAEKSIAPSVPTNETMIRTKVDTRAANEATSNRFMSVQVVQAGLKQPLPNVEIRFSVDKQKNVGHTDEQGRYRLDLSGEDPAYLSVTARKDGFVPMTVAWRAQSNTFELPREFTFALDPSVPVGGIVQNEQGQPVSGATVFLIQFTPSQDRVARELHGYIQTVELSVNGKVVTDTQGQWRYNDAAADASHLSFRLEHPDYIRDPVFGNISAPSSEKLHDMTGIMVIRKGPSITGTVLDTKNQPIRGAKVMQGNDRWGSNYPDTLTDAEGRFRFAHVAPGEMILTIQAEGYAPELDTIQVNDQTDPLEIHLAPGGTTRIRVVDPTGKPIAGAFVAADTWHGHRSLEWKTDTDAEGRSAWTSAPPDEVKFEVGKKGFLNRYDLNHMPSFKPSGGEQIVTLLPALRIHGTVVDAETGQPVPSFKVIPGSVFKEMEEPSWDDYRTAIFTGGQFEIPLEFERNTLLLRIEADGYQPTNSGPLATLETDTTLDFRLQKHTWPSGIVRAPNGQPVANADVFLTTSSLYVQNTRPMPGMAENTKTRTGADGSFKLSLPDKPFLLIATADSGFAEIYSETTSFPVDITLQPWGRVEGTFFIGSKPTAGQKITLNPDYRFVPTKDPSIEYQTDGVETDSNGHFAFERIRPGEMIIEPSYALVVIKSGETTSVTLGGTGRPVTGHIVSPAAETNPFNGSNAVGLLELKQIGEADIIRQVTEEKVAPEVMEDRLRQWHASEAGRAYQQARRIYRLSITPAGFFRANEVPAGTYSLHLEYHEPPIFNSQGGVEHRRTIGWLDTEIVVPEISSGHTDEPFDLGDVELKPVPKQ